MMENSNYTEPRHVVKAFVELGLDRQSRILDILAGSGVVAEMVRQFYRLIAFMLRNVQKIQFIIPFRFVLVTSLRLHQH